MIAPPVSANIASALPAMADRQPHTLAVAFPEGHDARGRVSYTHYTYRQLEVESNRIARGLHAVGIGRGVRTVLMVKPSLDFFALTFALFKVGAVPVLVDPGMGVRNLGKCLAEAEPEAFIGIPKAHLARRLLGWARHTLKTTVVVHGGRAWAELTLEDVRQRGEPSPGCIEPTAADEMAAILFTSGSTGVKGSRCARIPSSPSSRLSCFSRAMFAFGTCFLTWSSQSSSSPLAISCTVRTNCRKFEPAVEVRRLGQCHR